MTKSQGNYDDRPLEGAKAKLFRSVCMRLGFVAQDRTEIQYAWKEATRHMSQPTAGAMCRLKRLGRFLKYRPRCVQVFKQQEPPKFLTCRVDSDFAGCLTTRKSTSTTQLLHESHSLRSSAATQSVQALSSGEAEFHALVKGGSFCLGGVSMLKDLNT